MRDFVLYASPDFDLDLPPGHRFPGQKYGLLRTELLRREIVTPAQILPSPRAGREDLLLVHDTDYVDRVSDGSIDPAIMRRIGFPWSPQIPIRGERTVGGALAAARAALRLGFSGQLAGGTHHAGASGGAGYCIYNDLAVVAVRLLVDRAVRRVAIIDLDVHQGDGNAALLGHRDDVFILDLFGEKNFPFRKERAGLAIGLPDGLTDDAYLETLAQHLPAVFAFGPDLVLYQAGVDPLTSDRLGRLCLSHEGLSARDLMVLRACAAHGVPCSLAIGGGYADPIADTVTAYANSWAAAKSVYGF